MDLEGFMLTEINQSETDKYHVISLTCGIKNNINELTKQKQTYIYREQTPNCQKGGRFGAWVKKLK